MTETLFIHLARVDQHDPGEVNKCLNDPSYTRLDVYRSVSAADARVLLANGSPYIRKISVYGGFIYRDYAAFPAITSITIRCTEHAQLIDLRGLPLSVKELHIEQPDPGEIVIRTDNTNTGIEILYVWCDLNNVPAITGLVRRSPNVREFTFDPSGEVHEYPPSMYRDLIAPLPRLKILHLLHVPQWCILEVKDFLLRLDELTLAIHGEFAEARLLENIVSPLVKADNLKAFTVECAWDQPETRETFINWAKYSRTLESLRVGSEHANREIKDILHDKRIVRALLLPVQLPYRAGPCSGIATLDPILIQGFLLPMLGLPSYRPPKPKKEESVSPAHTG